MRDAVKLSYQAFLPVGGNREAEQKAALAVPSANTQAWQENGEAMKTTEIFVYRPAVENMELMQHQHNRSSRCNLDDVVLLTSTGHYLQN